MHNCESLLSYCMKAVPKLELNQMKARIYINLRLTDILMGTFSLLLHISMIPLVCVIFNIETIMCACNLTIDILFITESCPICICIMGVIIFEIADLCGRIGAGQYEYDYFRMDNLVQIVSVYRRIVLFWGFI